MHGLVVIGLLNAGPVTENAFFVGKGCPMLIVLWQIVMFMAVVDFSVFFLRETG